MGQSIVLQVLHRPATSLTCTLLGAIYLYITTKGIGYDQVGLSYEKAVGRCEIWRIITAQLSHVELLHLLFNLTALWSLGDVEAADGFASKGGVAYVVQMSIVLLLLSGVVTVGLYHVAGKTLKREQFLSVTTVGYSAVIFGWMTILAATGVASFSVFGFGNIPMYLTPFASLILTSIIIPRASFMGHLSGILVGFLAATGALDWLTLWWLASLAVWAAAITVYHMVRTERLQVPGLRMLHQDVGDIETGSPAVHIVGGVVERR
ncbi:hypothetical protein CVIRNUC_006830 [Coccomyxa viridis]|uniref:Peptidase S54 rhomboid domain-containing protein n=1 Tax=Coccomyxa viridis TaxID=1274662 RepID=A0AAV1I8F2_9CHLO|nr:hypothetical protein CVIRNUC_006830 [Coccomyxa viridis]